MNLKGCLTISFLNAMNKRESFYRRVLSQTIKDRDASVLCLGAGLNDKAVFFDLGFSNVTFSNVDDLSGSTNYFSPFRFAQQDAEALTFQDSSFDFVVIHAALHHCHSPHRALIEMYRVARLGLLAFEGRDSVLMRVLERINLTDRYEKFAVYSPGGKRGGVRNGPIPNFVYRWTEREVAKTIDCFAPHVVHRYEFFYGNASPAILLEPSHSLKKTATGILFGLYGLIARLFPRQQNLFAFRVFKPAIPHDLQPWIVMENGVPTFDMEWGRKKFGGQKTLELDELPLR